jgi:hypothetical protein
MRLLLVLQYNLAIRIHTGGVLPLAANMHVVSKMNSRAYHSSVLMHFLAYFYSDFGSVEGLPIPH